MPKSKKELKHFKRAVKHAEALGFEPIYLACFEDVGFGDVEAFVGIVHPAYADDFQKLANKPASKAHKAVSKKSKKGKK